MTTAQQTTESKVSPMKTNGTLAALLKPGQGAELGSKYDKVLQIAGILQTSLNPEEILAQFSTEIIDLVAHDHLTYINEKRNINFVLGKRARHAVTYELTINDEHLGILTLTRNHTFSRADVDKLEKLICAVHYPLRNALLYHEAVNAAHRDPLTGVGNRAAMNSAVRREIELAFRHNRSLGVIMMDVDHFKSINDAYGHAAGDYLLQSLTTCTEQSMRISDFLFRYGGEEFVIILPETDQAGVLRLAKRIRRRVEKLETVYQDQTIQMTVSLGVTNLRESDDEKTLFTRADEALYRAKRDGRNCIRVASPSQD
jgi:diguanylate cyclase (GGDEF)-like protein